MKVQVKLTVLQHETDKRYSGDAEVTIQSPTVKAAFSYEMDEPNNLKKFKVVVKWKNGLEVFSHAGALTIKQQLNSYSDEQIAIFVLLYRLIHNGVKETQRIYGGTTGNKPVRERVDEAIKLIGKEPVASMSFIREFVYEDLNEFSFLCKTLRSA